MLTKKSTLAFKRRTGITRSLKQGYQYSAKKDQFPTKTFIEIKLFEIPNVTLYFKVLSQICQYITVADPGFPRGGGANFPGGAPTYDFAKFSQKLHEIERIWAPRGGARGTRAPP